VYTGDIELQWPLSCGQWFEINPTLFLLMAGLTLPIDCLHAERPPTGSQKRLSTLYMVVHQSPPMLYLLLT
jgi:hypothetical protein